MKMAIPKKQNSSKILKTIRKVDAINMTTIEKAQTRLIYCI